MQLSCRNKLQAIGPQRIETAIWIRFCCPFLVILPSGCHLLDAWPATDARLSPVYHILVFSAVFFNDMTLPPHWFAVMNSKIRTGWDGMSTRECWFYVILFVGMICDSIIVVMVWTVDFIIELG
jgi:hypothetical protein